MQVGLSFKAIKYDKEAFLSIKKKVLLQYSKKNLMAYQHYRLTAFLYAVLFFICAPVCYSQQNSFDKQGNLFSLVNNKVDSSLENDFVLMNARYFIENILVHMVNHILMLQIILLANLFLAIIHTKT